LVFIGWREVTGVSSKIMSVFALVACTCAIVCWLFLIYWTFSLWQISLDPSRPKLFFLVVYVLGLFVVGISMSLSQLFFSLSKFKNDAE
jgi:membrane protein YdbS with pleckstrin-like domain